MDTTRRGLVYLVQLADLDRAMEHLPVKYWGPVLLHGLLGLPQDVAAQVLHISQSALSKRYRHGLEEITYHINGGFE